MDPFDVLGVARDASPVEIRRAFAAGVRAAHPDAGGPAASASDRLNDLIRARDAALHGPPPAAARTGRVVVHRRARGLSQLRQLVVTGLGWGRPKSGRNLR